MTLGFGCVHPRGEGDQYDGLYFKQNEMQKLARDLVGKPLCIEHMETPAGLIRHAWVGEKTPELYALFETHKDFPGFLAKNLIQSGACQDLSLGHEVTLDKKSVLDKTPTEVSICEQGARPHTHIYGIGGTKTKNENYILHMRSSISNTIPTMSDPVTTPPTTESTPDSEAKSAPSQVESTPMISELLAQMKQQMSEITKLQAQYSKSEKARTQAENQIEVSNKRKRDQREQTIEGTLKDYIKHMLSTYKSELSPHADELANMMNSMKESEQAEPMLQLLSCAAAAGKKSVTELEGAYQEAKRLKIRLAESSTRLDNMNTPAFSKPTERFVEKKGGAPALGIRIAPSMPAGIQLLPAAKDGMQVRNPNLWAQLNSGGVGPGMGWFSEPKLVGKEYNDGRRPKAC
jgi:hypothetical protein